MKKKFTKIAAAALAVAMTVASAVPTFAYIRTPEECYEHFFVNATVEGDHLHETCSACGTTRDIPFTKSQSECTHEHISEFNGISRTCTEGGRYADEICEDCGAIIVEGSPSPAYGHNFYDETDDYDRENVISEKPATCTEDGEITGKCWRCHEVVTRTLPALGHKWDDGVITKAPTKDETGVKTFTCANCGETRTESVPKLSGTDEPSVPTQPSTDKKEDTQPTQPSTDKKDNTLPSVIPSEPATKRPKVGTKFVVSGQTYKVTKSGKEVSFITAKKNVKSVSIPATVKSKGITYKVTSIAAKAVKSNKKLKSITVGANVSKIASNAFYKCPNVKTITIKSTKLTKKTASKKMVNGLNKKLVVKVPKKVKKSYAKIFKGLKIK